MSDYRRPTTRLGRKKDPRVDTVPPAPPKGRMSEQLIPKVEPLKRFPDEARTGRSARLEELLAKERAERDAEADRFGELLARATAAEASIKDALTQVAALESRLRELEREKAALESQIAVMRKGGKPTQAEGTRHDSVPTLATARAMASELNRVLDKIATREGRSSVTDLPTPKSVRGG